MEIVQISYRVSNVFVVSKGLLQGFKVVFGELIFFGMFKGISQVYLPYLS